MRRFAVRRFAMTTTMTCVFACALLAPRVTRGADAKVAECIAASEQAIKLRETHQLRAAREKFVACAAASCPTDIRSECASRVTEMTAAIPTVVFDVKDGRGNDLVAVTVMLDGAPLLDHVDGTAVALDPGPHEVTFASAGMPTVTKRLVLRESEKARTERVVLGAPPPEQKKSPDPRYRIAGIAIGAAGLVGVGLGRISVCTRAPFGPPRATSAARASALPTRKPSRTTTAPRRPRRHPRSPSRLAAQRSPSVASSSSPPRTSRTTLEMLAVFV